MCWPIQRDYSRPIERQCRYACGPLAAAAAATCRQQSRLRAWEYNALRTEKLCHCCVGGTTEDGAEKEQHTFDRSISVLRVLLAHRRDHLLGH